MEQLKICKFRIFQIFQAIIFQRAIQNCCRIFPGNKFVHWSKKSAVEDGNSQPQESPNLYNTKFQTCYDQYQMVKHSLEAEHE